MSFTIHPWFELVQRCDGTISLGNGTSVAVSPRFAYGFLLEHVTQKQSLADDARRLFDFFKTGDFGLILCIVWQASDVNKSLEIENVRTHEAYLRIRECLIQAIRDVHPKHNETNGHLPHTYNFLEQFDTVISLNYNLIVYWTMTYSSDIQDRHKFKDCFLSGGIFTEDWQRLRSPYDEQSSTLVFCPHDSLVLCRNRVERERRIHVQGSGLFTSILERRQSEDVVPLLVNKGTHEQKVNSVQNSIYLLAVYREVLTEQRENLVTSG